MSSRIRLGFAFIASLCLCATSVSGQDDPAAVAQGLRSPDRAEQARALRALRGVAPGDIDPTVRQALIEATVRGNQAGAEYMRRIVSGTAGQGDGREFHLDLIEAVVGLRDPGTVSVLLGAFEAGAGGILLSQAVAEFGEPAAPQILDAVIDPASNPYLVNGGLTSLRLMIELTPELSAATLEAMTRAAELRLTAPGSLSASVVQRAIDLAGVLADPRLDEILRALASDPAEVLARGVDPDAGVNPIERVQERARLALARVPPLPRPR